MKYIIFFSFTASMLITLCATPQIPTRAPREQLMTIESEPFFPGTVCCPDGQGIGISGAVTSFTSQNTDIIHALRLFSETTPVDTNPDLRKANDVELDETGNFIIGVSEENPPGSEPGGLWIIDISDKLNPTLVSNIDLYWPYEVRIYKDFAFTPGNDGRFRIVNIANKAAPFISGGLTVSGNQQLFAIDINTDGTRAYCAGTSGSSVGVYEFDTTDKTNPSILNTSSDFGAGSVRLDTKRNILFATEYSTPKKLKAFDTTNNLAFLGEVELTAPNLLVYLTLDIDRQRAFVGEFAGAGDTRIIMVDISDPSNMTVLDTFTIPSSDPNASLQAIRVYQGLLYVSFATGPSNGNAFLSIVSYGPQKFNDPRVFITEDRYLDQKIQIGDDGDGPIEGFRIKDDFLYLPLRRANSLQSKLTIAQRFDVLIRK